MQPRRHCSIKVGVKSSRDERQPHSAGIPTELVHMYYVQLFCSTRVGFWTPAALVMVDVGRGRDAERGVGSVGWLVGNPQRTFKRPIADAAGATSETICVIIRELSFPQCWAMFCCLIRCVLLFSERGSTRVLQPDSYFPRGHQGHRVQMNPDGPSVE